MSKLTLKSEAQIVADMAKVVLANTGLNDLNPGSVLLTLLQAASQEDFAQYYQMLQIVRNYNLDTTTGTDLENRAYEYGLTRKQAITTTGKVDILRESTFVKRQTTSYTGFRSRIAGDTILYVNNAEGFPTSGAQRTLIIGRGTPNEEEVTYTPSVTNPQNFVNYYQITLDVPLSNDHSLEETIILKQGADILIPAGTVLVVPQSGRTVEITFSTLTDATILAGEDMIADIDTRCTIPGVIGNIGVNAITGTTAFKTPPFIGARAQNTSAYTNGLDKESDTSLRNRIRSYIQSISQSTKAGLANAINGLVDSETAKKVVSSNIILPNNVGLPVKIYIDDGTGFEPSFKEQGQETIINSAQGGEQRVQLDLFPIMKAQVETLGEEPFDFSGAISPGWDLNISVGNESTTINFKDTDFTTPEVVTCEEIVKIINSDVNNLVEARTSQIGVKIVINGKRDVNENIQITGGAANGVLNFPTNKVETFYLYKNDILLSKDGETAFVDSGNQAPYDFSGLMPTTLVVRVDGKTVNQQTAIIQESDFATPVQAASATAQMVVDILNSQLAGVTASVVNEGVRITSNTELSSKSKVMIVSQSDSKLNYPVTEIVGKDQDYTLNPELGLIDLDVPLLQYDMLTAGSRSTRGFLTAALPQGYTTINLTNLQIKVDGGSTQTITFGAVSDASAQDIADFINLTLTGGTAITRTVGTDTFLEIRTNTFDTTGSIEILSASTANGVFGFTTNTIKNSILPHVSYQTALNSGPYAFVEGNTLVIVLDNDVVGKTFVITMDYAGVIAGSSNTTTFSVSPTTTSVFQGVNSLQNYYIVFKSGLNTTTGALESVVSLPASEFKYTYTTLPSNFEDFTTGDQVSISSMTNAVNDGNFLITGTVTTNVVHDAVINNTLDNPISLTPSDGDRFLIKTTANSTLAASVKSKSIANPSVIAAPVLDDKYIIHADANDTLIPDVRGLYVDPSNPGVSATHGYRYIINGSGIGLWFGHDQQIAEYNGVGIPGWVFYPPNDKDVALNITDGTYHQYSSGSGSWSENKWGSRAGRVAVWGGTAWSFVTPVDNEVRYVDDLIKKYQYDSSSNAWDQNDWGGFANKIAEWDALGSIWVYETPVLNDTVDVTALAQTYQFDGSAWAEFKFWFKVLNPVGVYETGSAGTGLIGQRRQIASYNPGTGVVVVTSPVRSAPLPLDNFKVLPSTKESVRDFFNNLKITSLSAKANIELALLNQKIQVSSKLNGSDGYVQVTGGRANDLLQFSNSLNRGLRAYSYYTGLIKLVHRTVYGDETDLVSYPGVGAAGVKFQILPPTVQNVGYSVEVMLSEGLSLSGVENDIKTQIIGYINSLYINQSSIAAKIVERVLSVNGVTDVKITSPLDINGKPVNIIPSENELLRTKASLISITKGE